MNEVSSSSGYHRRLRTALLANLNRSIADLYQLCDEEEDILMCVDATILFERGVADFRVLSDRLNARKKAGIDQNSVRQATSTHLMEVVQEETATEIRSNDSDTDTVRSLSPRKARSDENFKADADAEGTSPRSIITERSVDVAYASYITKPSDISSGTTATVEENKLTESSQSAVVEIIDNSYTKIQRSAIPTPSRCSTLRAAAAPFQPAALDVRSRTKDRDKDKDRECLGLTLSTQSNQSHDHDSKSALEGALLGSTVRHAPVALLKEITPARVLDNDITPLPSLPSLPGGVNGVFTQRLAPRSTVTALNTVTATTTTTAAAAAAAVTGIAPTQLATKQKSHAVNASLNITSTSTSSSQKSTGSKGKLSHSTVNSSAVSMASTTTELWHKKESNRAFFYESEKSDNNRFNNNQERRSSGSSNSNNNSNSNRGTEEWDAAMEAEVTEASEHVWRQVEKWIEAEAMAEEAAWNVLVLGHDNEDEERYLGEESDCTEEEFTTKPPESETDSMSPGDSTLPQGPDKYKYKNKNKLLNKSDQSPTLENSNSNSNSSNSGAVINGLPNFKSFALSMDKIFHATSSSSTALSIIATPSTATMTPSMYSCSTVTCESPRSSSPAADSTVSGISKFLHNKLSAPDRRRTASPTEVRRKQEAKQHSAESNRDKTVAERRQRALLVSDRAKIRGINEQKRLNLAESALEERLRDAEKRHEECIKVIKLRAGNENTKVSEVMFINNMNAEGIVDQLRQKLVEVEARVLAAVMRRQDILTGITARQRKRNNRKVQQMSELRLQLERQKMERWDKLQRRLEAVQVRRQARFLEMQRRSDAQELTRARLASTYYLTKEKEKDKEKDKELNDLNLNGGVKGLALSLTSITSTMNSFKAQLTSPLFNCGTSNPSTSNSNSNSTAINNVLENPIIIEKNKDKDKNENKDKDKQKEREKDKDKDKITPVVVASTPASAPAASLPASVSLLLTIPLPLPLPLPLPGFLPTAAITTATATATATANPVRLRLNTSISSPNTSESTIKNTASTPNKITGDTVSRVKSKNGHGSIKTAVVSTRPVKSSSSRPFITSLKSPSVSGSAGFFESPNAKVAVTMKSSTTFMRSNSGSNSGNNNNSSNNSISISNNNNSNNNNTNNSNSSNSNNSSNNILQVEVSASDSARGIVSNNRHKAITALCTTPYRTELRTCVSTELTDNNYPSLSPTESILLNKNDEKSTTNKPKRSRSNSFCNNNSNVDIKSTEITTSTDDNIQTAVLAKKKKKGKKKEKMIEKDEEMKLLDLLLSIKEKQKHKDFDIKSAEGASNNTISIQNNHNNNLNLNHNTLPGVVHMNNDLSSRPRALKHINSLAKLLRKKQTLKSCREQATGLFNGLYDIYLKTAKIDIKNNNLKIDENKVENNDENNDENKVENNDENNVENKDNIENENNNENEIINVNDIKEVFNLQYVSNSTVHNLVTFMCKNINTLSVGKAPTDKIEDYESLKLAIIFDVNVVLKKLESELDQRKEIGLFLKKGGNVLLRILLGDEIGLLSNRCCCIIGNIEEVTSSGLFMRICRAVNACNLTERARESSFSSGLTYLLSDITLAFSGHLNDWLAASQWCYVGEGTNRRLIFSNECQSIPLLFSALTCQLNRTANIITNPDIEPSCKVPYYGWIRYLFASGMVSSLCRDIRSMASLCSYASKEVFSYLLLYSLLECVDALCLCVGGMGLDEKTITTTSSPTPTPISIPIPIAIPVLSIDLKSGESIHTSTSTSTVTPPSTSISSSTSTSTAPPCDTKSKSNCALIPYTRKDMVYMLLDMQLAPTLVSILDSLLRYGDQWTCKRSDAGAGAGDAILKGDMHQSNLRPASVLSVAGQLIRSLEYLVTVDVSFIRYPRQTLLTENVKRLGDTLPLPSSRIEEVQVIIGTGTQRSLPVNIEVEVKDTIAIKLAKCCSMVLRSSIELLETPYEELKEAERIVCNTNTNTNTNYKNTDKNKEKDKNKGKDKEDLQLSIMPGIPGMPIHYAAAYMLRSSLISVSSVSKNNCMSSIQTETKELLLNFRAADAESVVKQVLLLIEKICSNSPDMIESFTGSTGSTGSTGGVKCSVKCSTDLIDSLIAMPPRYFRDDRYSTQLLPVLSTLLMGRKSELDTLIQEQLVK